MSNYLSFFTVSAPCLLSVCLLVFSAFLSVLPASAGGSSAVVNAGDHDKVVTLNNDAVLAISSENYRLAIEKLEEALRLEPDFKPIRSNLGIAYIKFASIQGEPKEAIKYLHRAVLLDPRNYIAQQKLNDSIKEMGKDPKRYSDRAAVGDLCRKSADFVGAIEEYAASLKLKDDAPLREKLGDVYRVRDENDKAIEQYKAAARIGDSASVQVKLGQAYQAKKDLSSAMKCYSKAKSMKSDDPLLQEALVAGWEEALKSEPKDVDRPVLFYQDSIESSEKFRGPKSIYTHFRVSPSPKRD
ncbi:hypothetical protein BH11CYA1_BH11CYA1_30290 [soil metagenome]